MNREPLNEITDEQVAAYRADGAVCLRGLVDADWIALLAQGVERDKADPGPMARHNTPDGAPGEFFVDFCLWRRHDEFRRFAFDSPAAGVAARMMGSRRVNFYHDHLLVKEPGTLEVTPWHQDQPYYPVDGAQVCSIWLPLDPVPLDICPEFLKGSHRWGRWFQPRYFKQTAAPELEIEDNPFEPMPDIEAERDRHDFLSWELEPGDCILFHALTVHGAPANPHTTSRRRGFATRWLGDDATYAARVGQTSPPIEGHGLEPGDPMHCDAFPRVWPRENPDRGPS
jgi:ectoine hydroxylase-related dioxygenase (phytanoyl-CoA dioxygenase family)